MKTEYMLKRLVPLYNRLGVEVSVNVHGVVRLRHPDIKDDCYFPSLRSCYELTLYTYISNPDSMSSVFYVLNSDGSTIPPIPL